MARNPRNSICKAGLGPAESAIPTAPEDFTEPLKKNVYGLPVTKGVEEPKRPSFEVKINSGCAKIHRGGQTLVACEK
jgi:hypothetical protein